MPVYMSQVGVGGAAIRNPLRTSLVFQLKGNESSGSMLDSINSYNFSANNSPLGDGVSYRTFSSGSAQYFSRADETAIRFDRDCTFAYFFYHNAVSAYQTHFQKSGELQAYLNAGGGSIAIGAGANGGTASVAITAATWYHMLVTYQVSTLTSLWYVNNTQVGIIIPPGGIPSGVSTFLIGSQSGFYMDGRMKLFQKWDRILTSGERAGVYNGGAGVYL